MKTLSHWRGRWPVALLGLAALVLWDFSGLDLRLVRLYGDASGFAWREAWLTRDVLHGGGRWLAGLVLAAMAVDAARPLCSGPSRKERAYGLGTVVVAMLVVSALKRFTRTSCPWDLVEFGGPATYLPHWLLGVADGGPGHCFPSGHAVAAFGFFGLYLLWKPWRPRFARAVLVTVWVFGLAFGWAQMARGAHFASHTLWSAWLCWVTCRAAERGWRGVDKPPAPTPAATAE